MQPPRFCSACGAALAGPIGRLTCSVCGRRTVFASKPCASGVVLRGEELLLVRRAVDPFKGWWDVPGGFLEPGEHPEHGLARELGEETGLVVAPVRLISIGTDVYGDDEEPTLTFFYECQVLSGDEVAADDADKLGWFPCRSLPTDVAFESARRMLAQFVVDVAARRGDMTHVREPRARRAG